MNKEYRARFIRARSGSDTDIRIDILKESEPSEARVFNDAGVQDLERVGFLRTTPDVAKHNFLFEVYACFGRDWRNINHYYVIGNANSVHEAQCLLTHFRNNYLTDRAVG